MGSWKRMVGETGSITRQSLFNNCLALAKQTVAICANPLQNGHLHPRQQEILLSGLKQAPMLSLGSTAPKACGCQVSFI